MCKLDEIIALDDIMTVMMSEFPEYLDIMDKLTTCLSEPIRQKVIDKFSAFNPLL